MSESRINREGKREDRREVKSPAPVAARDDDLDAALRASSLSKAAEDQRRQETARWEELERNAIRESEELHRQRLALEKEWENVLGRSVHTATSEESKRRAEQWEREYNAEVAKEERERLEREKAEHEAQVAKLAEKLRLEEFRRFEREKEIAEAAKREEEKKQQAETKRKTEISERGLKILSTLFAQSEPSKMKELALANKNKDHVFEFLNILSREERNEYLKTILADRRSKLHIFITATRPGPGIKIGFGKTYGKIKELFIKDHGKQDAETLEQLAELTEKAAIEQAKREIEQEKARKEAERKAQEKRLAEQRRQAEEKEEILRKGAHIFTQIRYATRPQQIENLALEDKNRCVYKYVESLSKIERQDILKAAIENMSNNVYIFFKSAGLYEDVKALYIKDYGPEAANAAETHAKERALLDRLKRERAERAAKEEAERQKLEKQRAEQEAKEKAARELREQEEREAKLRAEREQAAKLKAQQLAREKEAQAQKEAQLRAEKLAEEKRKAEQAKEQAERKAKEKAEREAAKAAALAEQSRLQKHEITEIFKQLDQGKCLDAKSLAKQKNKKELIFNHIKELPLPQRLKIWQNILFVEGEEKAAQAGNLGQVCQLFWTQRGHREVGLGHGILKKIENELRKDLSLYAQLESKEPKGFWSDSETRAKIINKTDKPYSNLRMFIVPTLYTTYIGDIDKQEKSTLKARSVQWDQDEEQIDIHLTTSLMRKA